MSAVRKAVDGPEEARPSAEGARLAAEQAQRSFERTLAGPSVGKAGLALDQTEINRIIAEASKGSKFYKMNERKEHELTEKIRWYNDKLAEIMATADREELLLAADRMLLEVESTRDLSQSIVHVDMDMFYAAVECQRDPSLTGKAFGVGEGLLTTASYEARKYGVRSGMAGFIARKLCPHIILTKLHFDLYTAASKKYRDVLRTYDETMMMAGLDEAYLNITTYMAAHGMTALEVVEKMRAEIAQATGLTCSAGIAPNRMLAKICSDWNKPGGVFEMEFTREAITRHMRELPARKIPGYGRVAERSLEGLGVVKCGDIYTMRAELVAMDKWFGFRGLCKAYLGIASNKVAPAQRSERKSVGCEQTFRDKSRAEDLFATLEDIAEELEGDLQRTQYAGRTVTLIYRLHTYERKSRARSIGKFVQSKADILPVCSDANASYRAIDPQVAMELLRKELPLCVRLLGIRVTNLKDLTFPDQGIASFFGAKAARSLSVGEGDDEIEEVDLTQEDAEDGPELVEDDFRPEVDDGGDRPITPPAMGAGHIVGPVCFNCNRALGPGISNERLNEHIDICLNTPILARFSPAPSTSTPSSPSTSRKRTSSTDASHARKHTKNGGRGGKGRGKPAPGAITNWFKPPG